MLKLPILIENESGESSQGIRPQPDIKSYFIEQAINSACATFGWNL